MSSILLALPLVATLSGTGSPARAPELPRFDLRTGQKAIVLENGIDDKFVGWRTDEKVFATDSLALQEEWAGVWTLMPQVHEDRLAESQRRIAALEFEMSHLDISTPEGVLRRAAIRSALFQLSLRPDHLAKEWPPEQGQKPEDLVQRFLEIGSSSEPLPGERQLAAILDHRKQAIRNGSAILLQTGVPVKFMALWNSTALGTDDSPVFFLQVQVLSGQYSGKRCFLEPGSLDNYVPRVGQYGFTIGSRYPMGFDYQEALAFETAVDSGDFSKSKDMIRRGRILLGITGLKVRALESTGHLLRVEVCSAKLKGKKLWISNRNLTLESPRR